MMFCLFPKKSEILPSEVSLKTRLTKQNNPKYSYFIARWILSQLQEWLLLLQEKAFRFIHKNMTLKNNLIKLILTKRSESGMTF